jgi:hypothetical protein
MGIDLGRFKQDLADQALEKRLQDNAVDKAVQKQKRKYSKKHGVSIHINIPEWHKPEFKRTKAAWIALRPHLTRNRVITISTTVAVLALLWGGLAVLKHQGDVRHARELADSSNGQPKVLSAQSKPTFTPAVPSGKEDLLTPDGTHSKFDASKGSYSYLDTLSGKQIIVSEQALPSADASRHAPFAWSAVVADYNRFENSLALKQLKSPLRGSCNCYEQAEPGSLQVPIHPSQNPLAGDPGLAVQRRYKELRSMARRQHNWPLWGGGIIPSALVVAISPTL